MKKRWVFCSVLVVLILLLSACEKDLAGKAIGDRLPQTTPQNFFCSFALQDAKHEKLCRDGNPFNNNPQFEVDDVAQPRLSEFDFFILNKNADSTLSNGRDGQLSLRLFPSNHNFAGLRNREDVPLNDVFNKITIRVLKPTSNDPSVRFPLFKYAFHSTNQLDSNGFRTWKQFDISSSLEEKGVEKLNVFDSLLSTDDPNNPNNLWYDLSTADLQVALNHELQISQQLIDDGDFAVAPEETHVVLFMCRCTNCEQQSNWVCNPRYVNPDTGNQVTFSETQFPDNIRYALEKVTITNECNQCYFEENPIDSCANQNGVCKLKREICGTSQVLSEQTCPSGCNDERCNTPSIVDVKNFNVLDGNNLVLDAGSNPPRTMGGSSFGSNAFASGISLLKKTANTGFSDFLVGAPSNGASTTSDFRRARIWFITMNKDAQTNFQNQQSIIYPGGPAPAHVGSPIQDYFYGMDVTNLGDLDGNGVDDIAIGSPDFTTGSTGNACVRCGLVWVYLMDEENGDYVIKEEQQIGNGRGLPFGAITATTQFGHSLENIGDINGDGINDIAISTKSFSSGKIAEKLFIVMLTPSGTVKSFTTIENPGEMGNRFAESITLLGDLDNDGTNDIAVGVSGDDDVLQNSGAVLILYLNNDGTLKSHKKIVHPNPTPGEVFGEFFGTSLINIGDLDNDGVVDLVTGSPEKITSGTSSHIKGALWVLYLNSDGTLKTYQEINRRQSWYTGDTSIAQDSWAAELANGGDIDNDGVNEILVGAPGKNSIWMLHLLTPFSNQNNNGQQSALPENIDVSWENAFATGNSQCLENQFTICTSAFDQNGNGISCDEKIASGHAICDVGEGQVISWDDIEIEVERARIQKGLGPLDLTNINHVTLINVGICAGVADFSYPACRKEQWGGEKCVESGLGQCIKAFDKDGNLLAATDLESCFVERPFGGYAICEPRPDNLVKVPFPLSGSEQCVLKEGFDGCEFVIDRYGEQKSCGTAGLRHSNDFVFAKCNLERVEGQQILAINGNGNSHCTSRFETSCFKVHTLQGAVKTCHETLVGRNYAICEANVCGVEDSVRTCPSQTCTQICRKQPDGTLKYEKLKNVEDTFTFIDKNVHPNIGTCIPDDPIKVEFDKKGQDVPNSCEDNRESINTCAVVRRYADGTPMTIAHGYHIQSNKCFFGCDGDSCLKQSCQANGEFVVTECTGENEDRTCAVLRCENGFFDYIGSG